MKHTILLTLKQLIDRLHNNTKHYIRRKEDSRIGAPDKDSLGGDDTDRNNHSNQAVSVSFASREGGIATMNTDGALLESVMVLSKPLAVSMSHRPSSAGARERRGD